MSVRGSTSGDRIVVRPIRDRESLQSIRDQWLDLASRLDHTSPFLLPQFLLPQIRWVEGLYDCEVLTAWKNDRLMGLAPVYGRTVGKWGLSFRVLSFPVHGTPPPLDFLIDPDCEGVIERFLTHWREHTSWDLMELSKVPTRSRTSRLLREAAESGSLRFEPGETRVDHFVPIESDWEEYLLTRSRNLRSNYNRAWRRCQAIGPTRVVRFPEEEQDLDRVLRDVFDVLDRSWKRPPTSEPDLRTFFRDLALELAAAGMLVVRLLTVDGRAIAYVLEIDYRDRLTAFHTAYDLDAQKLWAGILVLGDGVRHAHERQRECYDFAGEAKLHITQWADHQTTNDTFRIVNSRTSSKLKLPLYDAVRSRRRARASVETETRKVRALTGEPGPR